MNVLIVEDDEDKLKALVDFLNLKFEKPNVSIAKSFASGLRAVINTRATTDIILLDISMPNFDITPEEPSGGNPEQFAGRELLSQMKLRGIETPTIVVTMFDSFGDKAAKISLPQLIAELKEKYAPPYRDTIYYNSREEGWQTSLFGVINNVLKGKSK